jgi:hypothetical protein
MKLKFGKRFTLVVCASPSRILLIFLDLDGGGDSLAVFIMLIADSGGL